MTNEMSEKRSEAKSRRVGRALMPSGVSTPAYRAVVEFECIQCGHTIAPGALFSRQTRRTGVRSWTMPTTNPICVTCRPLRLEGIDETGTAAPDTREDR